MSTQRKTAPVRIGVRFTVDELPHLPPVEIIGQTRNAWKVTEIAANGALSTMSYRLRKDALIGKTVRILPSGPLPAELVPIATSAPAVVRPKQRLLTKAEFQGLKDVSVSLSPNYFLRSKNGSERTRSRVNLY